MIELIINRQTCCDKSLSTKAVTSHRTPKRSATEVSDYFRNIESNKFCEKERD
jgi:hypothetical protein